MHGQWKIQAEAECGLGTLHFALCTLQWWGGRGDGRDEPIPLPGPRLDELRRCRIITERPANLANTHFQRRSAHMGIKPDGVEQFLSGYQPTRVLRQVTQHGEAFGPEGDHL